MHAHLVGRLSALEIGKVTGFVVNVHDLLLTLVVERANALASRRVRGALKVGSDASPASTSASGDAILLVHGLGLLRRLVLAVEVGEGLHEPVADTVLLVHLNGALHGIVGEGIAMGKILGDDARARLVLLWDLAILTLLVV